MNLLLDLSVDDILHALSFIFTIILILLAVIKGMDNVELFINVLYFATLNITFLRYFVK